MVSASRVEAKGITPGIAYQPCHFPRLHAMVATGKGTTRTSVRPPTPTSKAAEVGRAGTLRAVRAGAAKAAKEKEKGKERARAAEKDCMRLT